MVVIFFDNHLLFMGKNLKEKKDSKWKNGKYFLSLSN